MCFIRIKAATGKRRLCSKFFPSPCTCFKRKIKHMFFPPGCLPLVLCSPVPGSTAPGNQHQSRASRSARLLCLGEQKGKCYRPLLLRRRQRKGTSCPLPLPRFQRTKSGPNPGPHHRPNQAVKSCLGVKGPTSRTKGKQVLIVSPLLNHQPPY